MADPMRRYETESKGPPLSSQEIVSLTSPTKALLRETAATIIQVLHSTWMAIIYSLGYSEEDLGTSDEIPTTKVFKILTVDASKYKENTEEWWLHFHKKLTNFGNTELSTECQKVYKKWKDLQSTGSGYDNIYPPLHSNVDTSYEHQFPQNHDIELDRPELSMEINVVAAALEKVSHNPATAEITRWLRDGVPRIIRLEREVRSLKTTKGISENQSHDLKNQIEDLIAENEQLQQQVDNLQAENEELKKCKQDEQLTEFDFVTRKEAQDIKDEEKVRKLEKQRSAPEGVIAEAIKDENIKLKMEVGSLKKQIDEIVKVNHSWDEHYRKMKTQLEKQAIDLRRELDLLLALRKENDQLKTETARHQQEMDITQKEKDTLLLQAKERIERLEKDKSEKQKEADVLRQKFEKVQGYARTLTNQRKEAEDEISRLNEALAQKMRLSSAEVLKREMSPIPSTKPPDPVYESIPSGVEALIANSLEVPQKKVESMSEAELREELEILRQQTDVYRSDFQHERQDRQRIMGELDETKKELKKYQHQLKGNKPQAMGSMQRQMRQDEQYAQQLQRQEEERQRPAHNYRPQPRVAQPRYQPVGQQYQQPRPHVKQNYYAVADIQNMQMPNKGLVPHGRGGAPVYDYQGYYDRPHNYAANDMWIDGREVGRLEVDGGDDEIDGGPAQSGENSENKNDESKTCPRCKRSFSQEQELAVHLDRCLDAD